MNVRVNRARKFRLNAVVAREYFSHGRGLTSCWNQGVAVNLTKTKKPYFSAYTRFCVHGSLSVIYSICNDDSFKLKIH